MKKIITVLGILCLSSFSLSAGMWDSLKDAYNNIKDNVKDAGDSVDYFKKCDDKKNIEYFQKENTHLHETLYVSSIRGTNIKAEPSASAKTLCVAPLNMPVRLMKVENKDIINNGESYWIKVFIPFYLQQTYNCGEYGYIFGNYLAHDMVDLTTLPQNWNKDCLKDLMMSGQWGSKNEFYFFKVDGTYERFNYSEKTEFEEGKWSVTDGNKLVINNKTVSVIIKDAWTITIDGVEYEKKYNGLYINSSDLQHEPAWYFVDKNGMNFMEYSIIGSSNIASDIDINVLHALGFTAKNTIFDDETEAYWRKKKGEVRNYHFENVSIADSAKVYEKRNLTSDKYEIDIDNDGKTEQVVFEKSKNEIKCYVLKDNYYYEVKGKNPIVNEGRVEKIKPYMALSLESPIPYFIVKKAFDDKIVIETYAICGTELKQICKIEEPDTDRKKDLKVQCYFDSDNFYVNVYESDERSVFNLRSSYVCEQNVNDIYSFTQKKLKLKNKQSSKY